MSDTSEVESPCVKICVVDPQSGHCIGCGRSRGEIADWLRLNPDERRAIMDSLGERMTNITRKRKRSGGRRGRRAEH